MNVADEYDRVLVRGGQAHDTVVRALVVDDTRHLTDVQYDRGSARVVVTPLCGQICAAFAFHDVLDLAGSLAHGFPHGGDRRAVHIRGVVAS